MASEIKDKDHHDVILDFISDGDYELAHFYWCLLSYGATGFGLFGIMKLADPSKSGSFVFFDAIVFGVICAIICGKMNNHID